MSNFITSYYANKIRKNFNKSIAKQKKHDIIENKLNFSKTKIRTRKSYSHYQRAKDSWNFGKEVRFIITLFVARLNKILIFQVNLAVSCVKGK